MAPSPGDQHLLQILYRLSKLQKQAAHIIRKSDIDTQSAIRFPELGWVALESRLKYNKAILTYKVLNNMTPDYIIRLLTPMSQAHSLNIMSTQ